MPPLFLPFFAQRWRLALQTMTMERTRLQRLYLLLLMGMSILNAVLQPDYYAQEAHLLHSLLIGGLLLAWRWSALRSVALHAATAMTLLVVVFIAVHTGGVHSASLAWLSVIALAVLMLQGYRVLRVWMVVIVLIIIGLKLGIDHGLISPTVQSGPGGVAWALTNHMMAALILVFVIAVYDAIHRRQLGEIEQRNAELRRVHQALIEAQAHKDEFVAAVGHELRTPMNAILGFNSVLHRELADRPAQVEVVDHIRHSTMQLLQVVNDILDVSQVRAGRLTLHPVDYSVAGLVREALHSHRLAAKQRGLALSADVDPSLPAALHGDRHRLLQILHKLLDNAIKFTPQGSVQLQLLRQGERLCIQVRDTGCGIPLQHQQRIFNRFEFADDPTQRALGGTGLGLALCEGLAQLLGGEIGVHSQPGQGSVFWLLLPMQAAQTLPAEEDPGQAMASETLLRILVVDDNPVNLQVARLQLQKTWPQAQIVTADSAAQALALLDSDSFDVALVDMVMPEMDGLQLTQHIRQRFPEQAAHMPILALTANTNPVERERCLAAGMDDVLHKPMDTAALRQSISHHVQRYRT